MAAKLASPTQFLAATRHLVGLVVPSSDLLPALGVTLAAVVLALEFGCAIALIALGSNTWARRVTLGLLVGFTLILILMLFVPVKGGCGCLGVRSALTPAQDAVLGFTRNAGLIGLLLLRTGRVEMGTKQSGADGVALGPRAFSLVEMLVVIAVIATLIAITLPAMRHTRDTGLLTRSQSNLRQMSQLIATYNNDWREMFPYLATSGEPGGPFYCRGVNISSSLHTTGYFSGAMLRWVNVFEDHELPPRGEYARAEYTSLNLPEFVRLSGVRLTVTTVAAPEFFESDPTERWPWPPGPQFRAVRVSEVLRPSQKGLLTDSTTRTIDALARSAPEAWSVSRCDGSAFIWTPLWDALDFVTVTDGVAGPIIATRYGVRGVDFQ
ncbi:MAG: type II secretion system protein [Planctomycetota bacterium]|nr:type II secretion system protein [Planctomycetota bacterium]